MDSYSYGYEYNGQYEIIAVYDKLRIKEDKMPNKTKKDDAAKNKKPFVLDDSFSKQIVEEMKKQKRMTQKELRELIQRLNTLYIDDE